jgi:hypothetical protein
MGIPAFVDLCCCIRTDSGIGGQAKDTEHLLTLV